MAKQTTVKIPAEYDATASVLRERLAAAIEQALAPCEPPPGALKQRTIALPPHYDKLLRDYAGAHGYEQWHRAALVAGLITAHGEASKPPPARRERSSSGDSREAQERAYTEMRAAVDHGQLLLLEGDAGIGKTRAVFWTLDELVAADPDRVVVYGVDTIDGILHTVAEAERAGFDAGPIRVLIGRSHYVDPGALRSLIEAVEDDFPGGEAGRRAAREWLQQGASIIEDNPVTAGLAPYLPEAAQRLLVDDLRACLGIGTDDPRWERLQAQVTTSGQDEREDEDLAEAVAAMRADTAEANVVVTTHATIAVDRLMRRYSAGVIAQDYTDVVIDEAHRLESAFANASERGFSVPVLRSRLYALEQIKGVGRPARQARQVLDRIHNSARQQAGEVERYTPLSLLYRPSRGGSPQCVRAEGLSEAQPRTDYALGRTILSEVGELYEALKRVTSKRDGREPYIQGAAAAAYWVSHGGRVVHVEVSPVRSWVSVTTGPRSVTRILERLWSELESAICMSATLSVPRRTRRDLSHITSMLGLDGEQRHRVHAPERIHARWRVETPTLHLPPASRRLVPPAPDKARSVHGAWVSTVAGQVAQVGAVSRGGVLVLCSSYDLVAGLAQRLRHTDAAERVIEQRRNQPFTMYRQQFIEARGQRPIWLACGPAWQGLDLSGGDTHGLSPSEDDLLTDLVVPRIPFGLVHSITHMARVSQPTGYAVARDEAVFLLRQGLGRLVRRPGVSDRHIWFLDPRPWLQRKPSSRSYYEPFRLVLEAYPHQRTIGELAEAITSR